MVKCMAEVHEGGQLGPRGPILAGGPREMSGPGVWDCWAMICFLNSAPVAAHAASGWMGVAEQASGAVFLRWGALCWGWSSPWWAWSFCTFVLAFSHLCARVLILPLFHSPRFLCQPRGPWACLCMFPPFLLDWKAVALDTLSSTLCCPKVLTEWAEGGWVNV